MCEEPKKKISFGFSKVSKKNILTLNHKSNETNKDIQFIDCIEEKSIKLIGGEEKKKEPPIIPMRNGNLLKESIREVVALREHGKILQNSQDNVTSRQDKNEDEKPLTLDDLAAKEILEDLKKESVKKEENNSTVALTTNKIIQDNESTLEDYENMPIEHFGLAMLRGMGWNPQKGIGLNEKIVNPVAPTLRPKGMGLGADKVPNSKNLTSNGELLIMKKGAAVKIVSGPYNNLYGKIEGFDELPGRLMVKIAENNVIVSLNEIMVQLVSSSEYNKNVEVNSTQLSRTEKQSQSQCQVFEKPRDVQSVNKGENLKMNNEFHGRNSRDHRDNIKEVSSKDHLETRQTRKNLRSSSDSDDSEEQQYDKKRRRNKKVLNSNSYDDYRHGKEKYSSRYKDHGKESRFSSKSSNSYNERKRTKKKSSKYDKYDSTSSDSDQKQYVRRSRKGKYSNSSDTSTSSESHTRHKTHTSYSKKHYRR